MKNKLFAKYLEMCPQGRQAQKIQRILSFIRIKKIIFFTRVIIRIPFRDVLAKRLYAPHAIPYRMNVETQCIASLRILCHAFTTFVSVNIIYYGNSRIKKQNNRIIRHR